MHLNCLSRSQKRHTSGPLLRWVLRFAVCGLAAGAAMAATFGTVVPIRGQASDLALDEQRGLVYVANYTANRIDVISTKTNALVKGASMNVSAQPSALALSPDGRYLVITHLSNFAKPANGLTIIDLTQNSRRTFSFGSAPMGVAFGKDGMALVVTTTDFLVLNPATGYSWTAATVGTVITPLDLPQPNPPGNPREIVRASVASSGDMSTIWGTIGVTKDDLQPELIFRYDVVSHAVSGAVWTSSPINGPRVVSVSKTGATLLTGWAMYHKRGFVLAQFPDALGKFGIGSHCIDSARGLVYAQVPNSTWTLATPPVLTVHDADNLAVREKIQLRENLAGRSLLSSDGNVMYAISASGLTILPVGSVDKMPRVATQQEDIVFRGQWCDRRVLTQDLDVVDPGGNHTDFVLSANTDAVTFSPSSGTTPLKVKVSIDMAAFQNYKGTVSVPIKIASGAAVNLPPDVRVLVNNREPDQRGTFINVPGTLVDIASDPSRKRLYVLRQDKNQVLVFDSTNFTQIGALRTGNTPWSMAITPDRRFLITGADNSQVAHVFLLDTLKPYGYIVAPFGHYPRSIAASRAAVLAASRVSGPKHKIDRLRVLEGTSVELPSLGVWENDIDIDTALSASPSGASIVAAQANGTVMLYDANADTFIAATQPAEALQGAVAALSDDIFAVNNMVFNSSLGLDQTLDTSAGVSSGFALVDGLGVRTSAPDAASPGTIERVDFDLFASVRPTRMTEAPVVVDGTNQVTAGGSAFTHTLTALPDRSAIVSLSTSGFTVLPWNYDAAYATPRIKSVESAADQTPGVATGGLFTIRGTALSPATAATTAIPWPTVLGDSCMTVNGELVPLKYVSPTSINGQIPFTAFGEKSTMILRTSAGVSNSFEFDIQPQAPAVFRASIKGWNNLQPTVVRAKNNLTVTPSNPIHLDDRIIIYSTGLGEVSPDVNSGDAGPTNPLAEARLEPVVKLGDTVLPVEYAGLAPGQVGVYQINAVVPYHNVKTGMSVPLSIVQGTYSTTVNVRVVEK